MSLTTLPVANAPSPWRVAKVALSEITSVASSE